MHIHDQPATPSPRFSMIIPAYNEERLLPRLLDSIDTARAAYSQGPDAIEVIVADNNSTDRTAEIARSRGCRAVEVEKRVIAAVRNAGARAARGEILAFIDADSQIHPRTFDCIDEALASGRVIAGATGVTLERWSLGIAVTYCIFLPMVWFARMDTGVVFCRRKDFETIGGYDERRLFAEDVKFLWDLRRLGLKRGQRLARATSAKAVASTRKFDEFGDWHQITMLPDLFRGALGLASLKDLSDRYWYKPARGARQQVSQGTGQPLPE